MDLDCAFVSAILKEGDEAFKAAKERGITPALLNSHSAALEFLYDYWGLYKKIPHPDVVNGRTGFLITDVTESAAFFIEEVMNRALHQELMKGVEATIAKLRVRKPVEALEELRQVFKDVGAKALGHTRTEQLPSHAPEVMTLYDKIKGGYSGIQTPWPSLNDATMGFWPEDLVLFAARSGIGKTWLLLILANHAWQHGHRVLFITTEMSTVKITQRWLALHLKLPYEAFRKARLGEFQERDLRAQVEQIKTAERFHVIGGDFDFRLMSVETAIEECLPAIVFVDGAYLLKTAGDSRLDRAANVFDELKRVAKRNSVPVIVSTQFNRQARPEDLTTISLDKIGLTDVAAWNADLVFGLGQTTEMKNDKRMVLKRLKFREGSSEDIELVWDFDQMLFSEPKGDAAEGSDFDSPLGTQPVGAPDNIDVPF